MLIEAYSSRCPPEIAFDGKKTTSFPFSPGLVQISVNTSDLRRNFLDEAQRQGVNLREAETVSQSLCFTIIDKWWFSYRRFYAQICYKEDWFPPHDTSFDCQFNLPRIVRVANRFPCRDVREAVIIQTIIYAWKHERQHLIHSAQEISRYGRIVSSTNVDEEKVIEHLRNITGAEQSPFQVDFNYSNP
jgi:hypothetical protein